MTSNLTYEPAGATQPSAVVWVSTPRGFRRHEETVRVGEDEEHWSDLVASLLEWGVKTASGFAVRPVTGETQRVKLGQDYLLRAVIGPFGIHEPVRVVAVIDQPDRCGFAYGTLPGHPVSGEEAFILHRTPDGTIWLTLRSLTQPAAGRWRLAFPAILLAQRWYRGRYRRALIPG